MKEAFLEDLKLTVKEILADIIQSKNNLYFNQYFDDFMSFRKSFPLLSDTCR